MPGSQCYHVCPVCLRLEKGISGLRRFVRSTSRMMKGGTVLALMGRLASAIALLLVLATITSSVPVTAAARAEGQFWTYDASMDIAGLNATGTVTHAFRGHGSVVVDGVSLGADLISISGQLSASSTIFGAPYNVSAIVGGTRYEGQEGITVMKEDSMQWTNISMGSSPPQLVSRMISETITNYSPPYMSKFNPSTILPSDSWTEPVVVNTTTIVNGTARSAVSRSVVYLVVVGATTEAVTVKAGTFDTLRITVMDSSGGQVVYWWSSKVQNFVIEKTYGSGDPQPNMVLSLTAYGDSTEATTLMAVLAGAALITVAVAVLAVILNARRPGHHADRPPRPPNVQDGPPEPPSARPPGRI